MLRYWQRRHKGEQVNHEITVQLKQIKGVDYDLQRTSCAWATNNRNVWDDVFVLWLISHFITFQCGSFSVLQLEPPQYSYLLNGMKDLWLCEIICLGLVDFHLLIFSHHSYNLNAISFPVEMDRANLCIHGEM